MCGHTFNNLAGSLKLYLSYHFLFAQRLKITLSQVFPGDMQSHTHECGLLDSQEHSELFKVPRDSTCSSVSF